MDFNQRDRMALRAALQKLSASASALAQASEEIAFLATRIEAPQSPHSDNIPAPTSVTTPPPAYPYSPAPTATTHGDTVSNTAASSSTVHAKPVRPAYPLPHVPKKPAKPAMSTEAKIMRGISIGGAAITIAGVILLVSVAIQRGWLGPLGRVVGAYLIAILLGAAAVWVRKRGTRVEGVVALVVTSHIAALATTIALIYYLEWWPPGLGSLVMLLISIGFLVLGRFWSTPENQGYGSAVLLATTVVTGFASWIDFANSATSWPVFGLIAALLISIRVSTNRIRIAIAVMSTLLQILLSTTYTDMATIAIITGSITSVLLVALSLWDPPTVVSADDEVSAEWKDYWRSFSINPTTARIAVVAPTVIMGFTSLSAGALNAPWWLLLPTGIIAGVGIHALHVNNSQDTSALYAQSHSAEFLRSARLISVTGLTLIAAAFVFIRYTPMLYLHQTPFAGATAVIAFFLVASALAFWMNSLEKTRDLGVVPWISWIIAAVAITGVLFRNVISLSPLWLTDAIALIQALLMMVFIGAIVYSRDHFYHRHLWLQLGVGAAILYLSATAIVTLVTYLGNLIGGTLGMMLGFLIGHAAVSILWMAIAAGLMLSRRLFDQPGALWTGVGLAVAGTVKLVFFDLVALDGVPRAIAFLASGIALLAIAAMRGRRAAATGDGDALNRLQNTEQESEQPA